MAYFIAELDERAQLDIRNRLETIKRYKEPYLEVDTAMEDKINIIVPELEWQEWLFFDSSLDWIDDEEFRQHLLDEYSDWQKERRKMFGYDYLGE